MTAPEQRGPLRAHAWVVPEGEVIALAGATYPPLESIVVNPLLAAAVAAAGQDVEPEPRPDADPGGEGEPAPQADAGADLDGDVVDVDEEVGDGPEGAALAADPDGTVTVADVVAEVLEESGAPSDAVPFDPQAESKEESTEKSGDGSTDGSAVDGEKGAEHTWEFACRVNDRVIAARYHHDLMRPVLTPHEQSTARALEQHAAVWVPVITFSVTAVCAVVVVFLATRMSGPAGAGGWSDLFVAAVMVAFLAAGFGALMRSQAYFDALRPPGRLVRYDVADAYETVRDAASVFVELGVPPQALTRIADLLPQAERLLDFLVDYQARGGIVKGHAGYEQLIRMGAEITVLTDMAEERLGRRSTRRRDRERNEPRAEHVIDENGLDRFESLSDLAVMIGVQLPRQRATTDGQG